MISLTIDGLPVDVSEGTTILEAARTMGIRIPTLCADTELHHTPGACRVCLVEVEGSRTLVASCVFPVREGMKVRTNSSRVRGTRKQVVEFLLSDHPEACTTCIKGGACELQTVAAEIGVREIRVSTTDYSDRVLDESSPALVRDPAKCINCHRCITACSTVQGVYLLTPEGRGFQSKVVPAMNAPLAEAVCTYCGQCAVVCPTAAIVERQSSSGMMGTGSGLHWRIPGSTWWFRKHRLSGPSWGRNSGCRRARW